MKLRQDLSAKGLLRAIREEFETGLSDNRVKGMVEFATVDAAMSGIAMFSLKYPSLLRFDLDTHFAGTVRHNLQSLYGVAKAPSDTQMRKILDETDPREVREAFKVVFSVLQRGKGLEGFTYLNDSYLLAIDGTGYFSSQEVHCNSCCQKHHKDGTITYYHQMLSGVLVHPEKKAVIPIAPEPIMQQDGSNKNDCERNAAERFLQDFRREHPHLKVIVTEDGLSSNAPHIKTLTDLGFSYILGCKPGDHKSLFEFIEGSEKIGVVQHWEKSEGKVQHKFRWMEGVSLNDANPDCKVNFLEYWETKGEKTSHWSWVTDIALGPQTVSKVMRAGRARWAIENETFNTLKNGDYCFEHNFGHGNKNLSTVLAYLMLLSFLIDQVQELACALFQRARIRAGVKYVLWNNLKYSFLNFRFQNWEDFMGALAFGFNPTAYQINNTS